MTDWKQRCDDARERATALEDWARKILAGTIENPQHLQETPAEIRGATVRFTRVGMEEEDAHEDILSTTAAITDVQWFEVQHTARYRSVVLTVQARGAVDVHDEYTLLVFCERDGVSIGWFLMEGAHTQASIIEICDETAMSGSDVLLLSLEPQ